LPDLLAAGHTSKKKVFSFLVDLLTSPSSLFLGPDKRYEIGIGFAIWSFLFPFPRFGLELLLPLALCSRGPANRGIY
jgi:hypothetical protein